MSNLTDNEEQTSRSETQECPGWYTRMPWIIPVWVLLVILAPAIVILMFWAETEEGAKMSPFTNKINAGMMEASFVFLLLPFRPLGILYDFLYDIMRNTFAALSAMLFSILHIAYWVTLIYWFLRNPDVDHSFARQWEIAHQFLMNLF